MMLLVLVIDRFRPIDVNVEALLNHFSVLKIDQVRVGLRGDWQLVFINLIVQLGKLV
jgi:hypothetical protein